MILRFERQRSPIRGQFAAAGNVFPGTGPQSLSIGIGRYERILSLAIIDKYPRLQGSVLGRTLQAFFEKEGNEVVLYGIIFLY